MRVLLRLLLPCALFALVGCASIISGRTQEVSFISSPEGATVTIGGRVIGKTPLTTALQKRSGQALVFAKDGYKPVSMKLDTALNGWFWGNIVFGGAIGSTTDAATGSMHKYSPSQYMVTLEKEGSNQLDGKPALPDAQKAKEYIVVAYKQIIAELGRKEKGEYIRSLLSILKVPSAEEDVAIGKIRGLSEAYPEIPVFADRVIELFLK